MNGLSPLVRPETIDIVFFDGRTRLRASLRYFRGLTSGSFEYLVATYVFFVVGSFLIPAAAIVLHIRPAPRRWIPDRISILTTVFFLITFSVLVVPTITVGYGRYTGSGDEAPATPEPIG